MTFLLYYLEIFALGLALNYMSCRATTLTNLQRKVHLKDVSMH